MEQDISVLKQLQINLFKHLKNEGFFLSNSIFNMKIESNNNSSVVIRSIENSDSITNVWAASLDKIKNDNITYTNMSLYAKKEISEFYLYNNNERKQISELSEKDFIRKQSGKPLPLGRGYSYIVIIR